MKYSQDKARHTLHVNFPEQKKSSSFEQTLIFRRIAQELPVWKKTLQNIVSFQTIFMDKTIVSDNQVGRYFTRKIRYLEPNCLDGKYQIAKKMWFDKTSPNCFLKVT